MAAPNVKPDITNHMDAVLTASFGMLNRKLSKNQSPVMAVGALTINQSSVHV